MPTLKALTQQHALSRSPLGEGEEDDRFYPFLDFLDSSKTMAYIDAKLSVNCAASIWRFPNNSLENICQEWRKLSFSDAMPHHFGQKKSLSIESWNVEFELKRLKTPLR